MSQLDKFFVIALCGLALGVIPAVVFENLLLAVYGFSCLACGLLMMLALDAYEMSMKR